MSAEGPKFTAPLWAYREPPDGGSAEWGRVYRAFADPVTVVATFRAQSNAACRGTRELLAAWHDRLRRSEEAMSVVLPYLHGRAPRTWTAGHAIRNAITPISTSLCSAVRFL